MHTKIPHRNTTDHSLSLITNIRDEYESGRIRKALNGSRKP